MGNTAATAAAGKAPAPQMYGAMAVTDAQVEALAVVCFLAAIAVILATYL
jgi:hypothetical protein